MAYPTAIIQEALLFRSQGKTYGEIRFLLKRNIPKSTLSGWCKDTILPKHYAERIAILNTTNLNKARLIAYEISKIKREEFLKSIEIHNVPVAEKIRNREIAKIALAMLCLGEAAKTRGSFSLGSSDPRIITLFLELLKKCFSFNIEKVRCTVQCRADQDIALLETYWLDITKIPKRLFYKARIDPRTKGKKTQKQNYKGVLKVDYFDTKVQVELEILAHLLYKQFALKGPVV